MRSFAIFLLLILSIGSAQAHDAKRLPLGDTLKSDQPKRGHLWPCHVDPAAGGATVDGPWIDFAGGTFDKTAKPQVPGDVAWPSRFTISLKGEDRLFDGNGLPPHGTGVYPIPRDSEAYRYDPNPNGIADQKLSFSLPARPALAPEATCAPEAVGILLTGIPLFSAIDAPGRDAVAHEIQDKCDGHPQPDGIYHYHNLSACSPDQGLIGYAVDGFGIFGPITETGQRLESKDLDACHGITSEIMWDGQKTVMYHYVATDDFPYTVGCLRGHADQNTNEALSGARSRFFDFFR